MSLAKDLAHALVAAQGHAAKAEAAISRGAVQNAKDARSGHLHAAAYDGGAGSSGVTDPMAQDVANRNGADPATRDLHRLADAIRRAEAHLHDAASILQRYDPGVAQAADDPTRWCRNHLEWFEERRPRRSGDMCRLCHDIATKVNAGQPPTYQQLSEARRTGSIRILTNPAKK